MRYGVVTSVLLRALLVPLMALLVPLMALLVPLRALLVPLMALLVPLMALSFPLMAPLAHASSEADPDVSTEAQQVPPLTVAQIEQTIVRHRIMHGTFTQHIDLVAMSIPISSRGRFYFHEDLGIAWLVDSPVESLTTLTDKGILADGRDLDAGSSGRWVVDLLQAMLRGDLDALTRVFSATPVSIDEGWKLDLVPSSGVLARVFERVELVGAQAVEQVVITNVNGDQTTIDLPDIEPLDSLPDTIRQVLEN